MYLFRRERSPSKTPFLFSIFAINDFQDYTDASVKILSNISLKKFITGLSYVAVSRIRTLSELLFDETFDYERFNRITKAASKSDTTLAYRKADAERRS